MTIAYRRTVFPANHVVHMSLDHHDPKQSVSVAECDCGWLHRVPWPGEARQTEQDGAIENHWQEVERRTSDVSDGDLFSFVPK